jgi:hypothetical protein
LPDGKLAPPPVPPLPGKSGEPNEWVYQPNTNPIPGQRPGRWKPRDKVPHPKGSQPNASWDDDGHWDIDLPNPSGKGKGTRVRVLPDGTLLGPDHMPLPAESSSVMQLPNPDWLLMPGIWLAFYAADVNQFWDRIFDDLKRQKRICGCTAR